jgi:sec-independent protein translocase protein TatA
MMPTLGAPELIIILVIIVLIFGVGKLPEVGQALGKGIREFRGAADGDEDEEAAKPAAPAAPARPAAPVAVEAPRTSPVATVAPTTATATPVAATTATTAPAAPVPATTATSAPAAPVTTPVAAAAAAVTYVVVEGDTPTVIAEKHGVTVEQLLAANGWSKADRVLYEGDKIQVPTKTTVA